MTVTGRTLAENVEGLFTSRVLLCDYAKIYRSTPTTGAVDLEFHNQDVIRPLSDPIKSIGHITILHGSLAPDSAVAKLTGKEGSKFEVSS